MTEFRLREISSFLKIQREIIAYKKLSHTRDCRLRKIVAHERIPPDYVRLSLTCHNRILAIFERLSPMRLTLHWGKSYRIPHESGDFWHGFVFPFTQKRTNPGSKNPDCVTNPNTLNQIKKWTLCIPKLSNPRFSNAVFSVSEDFLRPLRPSRLQIVHFIRKFFPDIRTYSTIETDFDYILYVGWQINRRLGVE